MTSEEQAPCVIEADDILDAVEKANVIADYQKYRQSVIKSRAVQSISIGGAMRNKSTEIATLTQDSGSGAENRKEKSSFV